MNDIADEVIVGRVQAGDTHAFGVLVERYEDKIKRYARRFLYGYDAIADSVQDVFIKAYTNIQSFDTSRRFSPWIYRIAHNEFVNAIKKQGKEKISLFDTDTVLPHLTSDEDVEDTVEAEAIKKMLEQSLDKLDPKYREILVLYFYEELDYKEIAEVMQIPISTVGVRIRRGKVALKKVVDKHFPHYER